MPSKLSLNEDGKSTVADSYNILVTGEEKDFNDLTVLASAICQTPIALINLIDEKNNDLHTQTGTTITKRDFENSFAVHSLLNNQDITVVEDLTQDERFDNKPFVLGKEEITFYAGVPLINDEGYVLGSLCVIDSQSKTLTLKQIDALKIIARQIVDKLELRKKAIVSAETIRELRDSNLFMQKFAAMAAHDIKNPLSSILLSAQSLKSRLEKLNDERCGKLVDLNISSTQRLMGLLGDMLEYSKKPALLLAKKEDIDLTELLRIIISMVNTPDNFEIRLPEGLHSLNVSIVAIQQIFINLLTNAIRYNDKDRGVVTITFRQDDQNYYFEVADNGIGIAEAYHEKIFNNSFTLKITDRYEQKGSGIGLSTVKELVKALNGKISVSSVPGRGTTFFISISK